MIFSQSFFVQGIICLHKCVAILTRLSTIAIAAHSVNGKGIVCNVVIRFSVISEHNFPSAGTDFSYTEYSVISHSISLLSHSLKPLWYIDRIMTIDITTIPMELITKAFIPSIRQKNSPEAIQNNKIVYNSSSLFVIDIFF